MEQDTAPAFTFLETLQIRDSFSRIGTLLGTGILMEQHKEVPFVRSAVTELLICLNDVLQKCKDVGQELTFAEDIEPVGGNITDLISWARNAACHLASERHKVASAVVFTFSIAYGKVNVGKFNEVLLNSDYSDDVAIFFGPTRVYVSRHCARAYLESRARLEPLMRKVRDDQAAAKPA